MNEMLEKINEFKERRQKSPLCRLMLYKNKKIDLNSSQKIPLSFQWYRNNSLDKLDAILKKLKIEEKATTDFKLRFKDKAFLEDEKDEFKYYNIILSNIVELLVSTYLAEISNEGIIDLSAWSSKCKSDIKSKNNENNILYTEVKYLGPMPDINDLIRKSRDNNQDVITSSISNPGQIYNYINIRIADAVFQLKEKNIGRNNRRVFLVIEESLFVKNILNQIKERQNWDTLSWNRLMKALNIDTKKAEKYKKKNVNDYYKEANILIIALLNENFDLKIAYNTQST